MKCLIPAELAFVFLFDFCANPVLDHLNKRGIFTNFWVINEDDEIEHLMKNSHVRGIMTDRPAYVQKLIEKHTRESKNI